MAYSGQIFGEMDTLVTLQRDTQTRGALGDVSLTFTDVARVWAKIDRTNSELANDNNQESEQTVQLTIHEYRGLTSRWRIKIGDTSYEITAIQSYARWSDLLVLTIRSIAE